MRLASRLATLAPIMLSSQHSAQAHQAARLPKAHCVALLLGAWMLAALPAQAAEVAVTVSTLDGKTYTGKLQQLADDALKVATAEGVQSVPLANLLALTPEKQPEKAEPTSPIRVELTDGSQLVADSYTAASGTAKFGFQGKPAEIRTRRVAAVRLQEPTQAIEEQWRKIRSEAQATGDLVLIRKGDAVDHVEGVLGNVTEENVELDLDGSKIPVKRTRVDGLIYFHRQSDNQPDPLALVLLADGSQLAAAKVATSEAGLAVETLAGFKSDVPWEQLRKLDFSAGKIQYLNVALGAADGALLPDEEKVTEFLQLKTTFPAIREFYRPRSNSWGVRRPLKLQGQTYERGLALRSRTELVYRIRGKYRRFQAVAGIDESVAGQSNNVRLTIVGDGRTLYDELIHGTDAPRDLDIDIAGVSRLEIKVDYGDDGLDSADLLNLCEARVTK